MDSIEAGTKNVGQEQNGNLRRASRSEADTWTDVSAIEEELPFSLVFCSAS